MGFEKLIQISGTETKRNISVRSKRTVRDREYGKKRTTSSKLGCENCPSKQNWKHGVKPIFGIVAGHRLSEGGAWTEVPGVPKKKIMVWAQSPGPQENKQRIELIGPSGDWFWKEMAKAGITRDACDIQNAVRCFPVDYQEEEWPSLKMRSPNKEEIKCCSFYTNAAAEQSTARVHLIFGAVAHKAVLGQEFKKNRKVFYSERLRGTVFCLDHPSYFLRSGFGGKGQNNAPTDRLKTFRRLLKQAQQVVAMGKTSKFAWVKSRQYTPVENRITARKAYRDIKLKARSRMIAVDSEHSRGVSLCYSFITEPGKGWVFPTDAKLGLKISPNTRRLCKKLVKKLLTDPKVRKALHHGSSDVGDTKKHLGVDIEGYEYDTEYGEYFVNPDISKAYGLDAITDRRFPKFAGAKEIILPEAFSDEWLAGRGLVRDEIRPSHHMKLYDAARKENGLDFARIPWPKLYLRCALDADITKRIQITTSKKVNPPLMRLYRDSAFVLARMEKTGPLFDYQWSKQLRGLYPMHAEYCGKRLTKLAKKYGMKKFKPSSPQQITILLFDKLKLTMPPDPKRRRDDDKPQKTNTQKETLKQMVGQHWCVQLVLDFRTNKKTESTYQEGYEKCANINGGRLRTKFWLTGTDTGRLSSGGGKEKVQGDKSIINLQNIHGDKLIQSQLISDPRWREIQKDWKSKVLDIQVTHYVDAEGKKKEKWVYEGGFTEDNWQQFGDYYVMLGFDFAQMEMRFLAELSNDKELQRMFSDPKNDPHSMIGNKLTGISIEKIKNDDRVRRMIKALQFGIIYGLKAPGLVANLAAQGIVVTIKKMEQFIEKYFQRFRGARTLLDSLVDDAEINGYVETVFGFRRPINVEEQKFLGNEWEGAYWANQAVNSPIQGGAHQMMLISVAGVKRRPVTYSLLQKPSLEIHDALYFFVQLKNLWLAIKQGKNLLEKEPIRVCKSEFDIDWHVPLKAEPKAGFRFGVQVKDLGLEGGPQTTSEFLNKWCQGSREHNLKLKYELKKLEAVLARTI